MKLFSSPACVRNKGPIQQVLAPYLKDGSTLFEVGSATAEHALHIAELHPNIHWISSDCRENHDMILHNFSLNRLPNISGPLPYQAGYDQLSNLEINFTKVDFLFSANTLHIMSWSEASCLFRDCGASLKEGTYIFFYGPFKYNGKYTSESNAQFDDFLKERNPVSGIRDFENVLELLNAQGFELVEDHSMAANNQLIIFKKSMGKTNQ